MKPRSGPYRKIAAGALLATFVVAGSPCRALAATDDPPSAEASTPAAPEGGALAPPESAQPEATDPLNPRREAADLPGDSEDPPPAQDVPYWRTNFFRRFFSDQRFFFRTWAPSEARNPAFYAPFLVTTALAYASGRDEDGGLDARLEADFHLDTQGTPRRWARYYSDLGNAGTGIVLLGVGYFAGRWSGHDRLAEASSLSAEAALSAGLWSTVLKAVAGRNRPSSSGTGDFGDYDKTRGEQVGSFPSGHATGAFAVATVFSGVYSDHKWMPWLAYGTAGMIGLSRVALARHFPSDVIAGALLGNSLGRMVLARRNGSDPPRSSLQPLIGPAPGQVGLAWNYSW
jgi:membrane-associated phospholipid phosphatase